MEGILLMQKQEQQKLRVNIIPNSSKNEIISKGKIWKIRIAAPPEKGKANEELLKFLKKTQKIRARIVKCSRSREKILEIL